MAWWKQSAKPSGDVVDMDEEEAVIDLTSDTEASSPAPAAPVDGLEVISPWALQQIAVCTNSYKVTCVFHDGLEGSGSCKQTCPPHTSTSVNARPSYETGRQD